MPIVQHWIKAPNINHQLLFSMRVGGGAYINVRPNIEIIV